MRRHLGTILVVAGSALLIWCASVWTSSALFESWEAHRWKAAHAPAAASPSKTGEPVAEQPAPKPHDVIAWLDIPRLRISTAVLEGDDGLSLRYGAGHIPGTPLPGAAGNVGIAAHRDSYFRALRGIKVKDQIKLRTPGSAHSYSVEWTRIVSPSDVSVLNRSARSELTLITCYPFHYVGPAPLRFVVEARQLD
jgi:sortase A